MLINLQLSLLANYLQSELVSPLFETTFWNIYNIPPYLPFNTKTQSKVSLVEKELDKLGNEDLVSDLHITQSLCASVFLSIRLG